MNKKLFQLLIIFLLAFIQRSFAQGDNFIHLTEDDGLINNTIKCILKDSDGYLWLGTENGLSKYDGTKFINYRKSDGLPGIGVWALASNKSGTIYAGCYVGGLCILENNRVTKILHIKSKYPDTFRRLLFSQENNILVAGTDYGLFLLKDTTFFEVPFNKASDKKTSILNIFEYKGNIYTTHAGAQGEGCGLFKLKIDRDHPQLSTIEEIDKENGCYYSLAILHDTLYTNKSSNLITVAVNNTTDQNEGIKLKNKFLPWISCAISNHEILVGGFASNVDKDGGLELIDLKTKKVQTCPIDLTRSTVNDIFCDTLSGVTWIGADNGLYGMFKTPFNIFKINELGGLKDAAYLKSQIYLLGSKGVYTFKDQQIKKEYSINVIEDSILKFRNEHIHSEHVDLTKYLIDQNPPNVNYLKVIDDKLYLVSNNGSVPLDLKSYLPFSGKNFVFDDKGGCFFVPEYAKLWYYPRLEKLDCRIFSEQTGGIGNVIKIIYSKKICYLITWNRGLYAIRDNQIYNLNQSNSTIDNYLTDIELDPAGELWCTSLDGHLFQIGFDTDLHVLTTIGKENSGLIGDNYKWLKFNSNNLYLGTNKGINILDIQRFKDGRYDLLNFYNRYNGWEQSEADSPFTDDKGNIYLFTTNNLIEIKNLPIDQCIAKLAVDAITVDNKSMEISGLSNNILSSNTKNITISFLLLKYPSSKNTLCRYKLNDGNWVVDNRINLEPLKSGDYSIELDVLDKESGRHYGKIINFKIDYPVWQMWWFSLILVISLIIIALFILRLRVQTVKKQQAAKYHLIRQISELQIRSLQVQMNPHFIFNSLNSIQNFIVTQNTKEAIIYLGSLGSLIRMNLENVVKEAITLEQEIDFLKEYIKIEQMRFKKKLKIVLNNEIPNRNMLLPPMIVQPIIENAIKHGVLQLDGGGLIVVNFTNVDGITMIAIEDNGVGRKESQLKADKNHNSKGLGLIEERLQLLNQKHNTDQFSLEVIDLIHEDQPTGTKVILNLLALNGL